MLYIKLFIEREKNIGQSAPECPFKLLLATARAAYCRDAVHLFVCLLPKCKKNAIFSKTKQFRAIESIDDL